MVGMGSKMVTSFHMQLDCQFLAVVDVCKIETCCTIMYDRVSCSLKQLLRRVEAYQWFKLSEFCRQVMSTYIELTECYISSRCDHADLVELHCTEYEAQSALVEVAKMKSDLRQHCVLSKQVFGDWIAKTMEVTQTSYKFWEDFLKVSEKRSGFLFMNDIYTDHWRKDANSSLAIHLIVFRSRECSFE